MPTMPLVGDELAGYRLMGVVGRGGMSVVYRAENPRLGSMVALKVLAPEIASVDLFRTRFLQESRIAASLSHPNVIPIYDMGSHGDLLYIAMRYVNGHDMRDLLRTKRVLHPEEALFLVGQGGRALDYAHRHSLVHRDVKPANLLVEPGVDDEDSDHVFLADFGITKHALSRTGLTPTGQFMGTLDYVAPEQIQGKEVGNSADIYYLGCVLYEALTWHVPFVKDIDVAVLWAHVEEPPPAASSINPALPAAIDDVLARALMKNPEDRYASCREMVGEARAAFAQDDQLTARSSPVAMQRRSSFERPTPLTVPPDDDEGVRPGESLGGPRRPAKRGRPSVGAAKSSASAGVAGSASTPAQGATADVPQGHAPGRLDPIGADSGTDFAGTDSPAPPASGRRDRSTPHDPAGPLGVREGEGSDTPLGRRGSSAVRRRAALVAGFVSLVVLALIAGIWFGAREGGPTADATKADLEPSASPSGAHSSHTSESPGSQPLAQAIALANTSTGGLVPADKCTSIGDDQVACDHPHVGISQARFRTYASLGGVYAAYKQRLKGLSDNHVPQENQGDCNSARISGEVSWNHNYEHPRHFTTAQVASGDLRDDTQAAGRVFCRLRANIITIVWTDNHAKMLGTVIGSPHSLVFRWWKRVHHDLAVGAMTDMSH